MEGTTRGRQREPVRYRRGVHETTVGLDGFFDDEDAAAAAAAAAAAPPSREEFRAPAWLQAPDDELPARLLHDTVIARTDAAVVVLREVRVFSIGFEVHVDWFLRRGAEEPWEWHRLAESVSRGGWVRDPTERETTLRFGLALPDGRKVQRVDLPPAMPMHDEREAPTAMPRHGGGGGGDRTFTGSNGLWVWSPDPLLGELTLVTEWTQAGIAATAIGLDGDEIADATRRVRLIWESPAA